VPCTNVMSLIGQLLIYLPQVTLPVYLNNTRAELLFTLDFKAEGMTEEVITTLECVVVNEFM